MKKIVLTLSAALLCLQGYTEAARSELVAQNTKADCGKLSSQEQQFANQLMDDNRMMFCSKMTPSQRKQVMNMANRTDSSGNNMTGDQAVRKFAMENNMSPSTMQSKDTECEHLSPQEKQFARQMNDSNRTMFCKKMNAAQRKQVMNMGMNPDQAMRQQMMQNNSKTTQEYSYQEKTTTKTYADDDMDDMDMMGMDECMNLSDEEMDFADQMNKGNRSQFCKMSPGQRRQVMENAMNNDMDPDQAMQMGMGMGMNGGRMEKNANDCRNLNSQEMQFARQLNNNNKKVFCNQLSAAQRKQVMSMASRSDSMGNRMSEDQAMQTYMRQNNIRPMEYNEDDNMSKRPYSGGACPVK